MIFFRMTGVDGAAIALQLFISQWVRVYAFIMFFFSHQYYYKAFSIIKIQTY